MSLLDMLLSYLYDCVNMLIRQMVEDLFPFPSGRNQLGGFQNLQLMRHGGLGHVQRVRDILHAGLAFVQYK